MSEPTPTVNVQVPFDDLLDLFLRRRGCIWNHPLPYKGDHQMRELAVRCQDEQIFFALRVNGSTVEESNLPIAALFTWLPRLVELAAPTPAVPGFSACIFEDCDQEAVYCAAHAREVFDPPAEDAP